MMNHGCDTEAGKNIHRHLPYKSLSDPMAWDQQQQKNSLKGPSSDQQ